MPFSSSETIAAISTAMSESGIGIVRICGMDAFQIAEKIYYSKTGKKLENQKSHTIHYGYVVDGDDIIDEVLVMLMRGPRTFTGEDTVEINCHGGVYVIKKILETILKYGARPAEPGEFTKRAFLNGKMDLSQAEAVIDIIQSKNEYSLKSSVSQLKGNMKEKIKKLREKIIYHTAFIETALDDPEHISIDGYSEKLKKDVLEILYQIKSLLDSFDTGRIMKEGIRTVILGKPNAGKSSLLNALLGQERAIVTEIAGTTRDILEENINLQGISLNIIDTAGIRDTEDTVEKIGVWKAKDIARDADFIIYVIDASVPLDDNDIEILKLIKEKKFVILLNKSDLNMIVTREEVEVMYDEIVNEGNPAKNNDFSIPLVDISLKNKDGLLDLEQIIKRMFYNNEITFNDEVYITNIRHKNALNLAYESLKKVIESIEHRLPEDFYSIDLMDAYEFLGNITGETIGEDLINEIFSKFCMGK